MGTSRIVPLVIYIDNHPAEWSTKDAGQPTSANLDTYIHRYAKSLELGGVNQHLSRRLGYVPYPSHARIVRQRTREVLATWTAGMFHVWSS